SLHDALPIYCPAQRRPQWFPAGGERMIELPLPPQVERQLTETCRRVVPMLRGMPRPEHANGIEVVMVSGLFGTKEDFREVLALIDRAGYREHLAEVFF